MIGLRIAVWIACGAVAFGCSSEGAYPTREQGASIDQDSATAGDTTAGDTTGGGDERRVCSLDVPCGEKEYCDYADDSCGVDGATGVCVGFPLECSPPPLFCNCEGEVTTCMSSDVSRAGGCELALTQQACGDKVCDTSHEICVELKTDESTSPWYTCRNNASPPCSGGICDCTSFTQVCQFVADGAHMESCEETEREIGLGSIVHEYFVSCVL